MKNMTNKENVYKSAGYGFDSSISATYGLSENYGESFLGFDYRTPVKDFGFPSDPRTANQLQAVSQKISTGAGTIEVSGVNITGGGPMKLIDTIPKQQFKEINRLKKLTGVDLTFHGPLVEATGFQGRQGWTEEDRKQAERQMISAVQRSHELDPKGNLVVTFHSSNGLPDPETIVFNEKGEKEIKDFWAVDEYGGQFRDVVPRKSELIEIAVKNPEKYLEKENKDQWFGLLESINFNVRRGAEPIDELSKTEQGRAILKIYGKLDTPEGKVLMREMVEKGEIKKEFIDKAINDITFGDLNLRQAYQQFQGIYDRAYNAADSSGNESTKAKLKAFGDEIRPTLKEIEKDPSKVDILAEDLKKGIQLLRTIETPQLLKPLKNWAIEKAGETFANVALASYKKFGETSPIISIENPPAGSGLSRAEDLRDLVKRARYNFVNEAKKKLGMSESQAKTTAEKLIGVTWDVGHINMLRGQGYEEKQIIEQTKTIASFVKHVHLSDNFGLEHTELPMGMGNVPTKKHLELIDKYNKQVKKIVETGDWFSRQGGLAQTQTPVIESVSALGSPVYSMKMAPYWNQIAAQSGYWFTGLGATNPEIHHSIFGAGFSTLPLELGGQMAGRSRVSGDPLT